MDVVDDGKPDAQRNGSNGNQEGSSFIDNISEALFPPRKLRHSSNASPRLARRRRFQGHDGISPQSAASTPNGPPQGNKFTKTLDVITVAVESNSSLITSSNVAIGLASIPNLKSLFYQPVDSHRSHEAGQDVILMALIG
ncbi:hypothetical protein K469DRAFT_684171 [Zopfia rhizophila CBS 207.26]|uniref:Uncharacterized protein n=1 Tax=Zopfia rhizophila CBS 207.26 TaxID=1314779 RepID=A0A6A6EAI9_9PEZI|nr:hypothetical protein K469DRAFT_684171 [Zopfia rhizophila CBS 207.26]